MSLPQIRRLLPLLLLLAAAASAQEEPHPHQGILPPYEPRDLEIDLTPKQLEKLADGKLVQMTVQDDKTGGTGIGVIDIAAPPDTVWSRIMGFEHYPEWVGPVKECEVYRQAGDTINTHVKISGFMYKYEYYLTNVFLPEHDMLTWTLDYSRKSDFDDCVGAWYVEAHPDKAGWSRAWFSSDLKLKKSLPGFMMNFIRKKGIKDAIAWVKEQSEMTVQDSRNETDCPH